MSYSGEREFDRIYKDKLWGSGAPGSPLSGAGSNPDNAITYVNFVRSTISRLNIRSVLDVGHGDWEMWRDYQFDNTSYIGVDVADGISDFNNKKYGNSNRKFVKVSIGENLPNAELLLCKDVLQHLSNQDIKALLKQKSSFEYLIFCDDIRDPNLVWRFRHYVQLRTRLSRLTHLNNPIYMVRKFDNNLDIVSGGYRTLDILNSEFADELKGLLLLKKIKYKSEHSKGMFKRVLFFKVI